MIHLLSRYEQYNNWINTGEPAVIWLSGLHIPESFLTALVQATCRKNSWPLDKSTLFTSVTHYMTPEDLNERAHSGLFTRLFNYHYISVYNIFFALHYVQFLSTTELKFRRGLVLQAWVSSVVCCLSPILNMGFLSTTELKFRRGLEFFKRGCRLSPILTIFSKRFELEGWNFV